MEKRILRAVRGAVTMLLATGMLWSCLACSSDDDDDGGDCESICSKVGNLCGEDAATGCLQQCGNYSQSEIDDAQGCVDAATDCAALDACDPHG